MLSVMQGTGRRLAEYAPHLDAELVGIVEQMMARLKRDRPRDATEAIQLLQRWRDAQPTDQPLGETLVEPGDASDDESSDGGECSDDESATIGDTAVSARGRGSA